MPYNWWPFAIQSQTQCLLFIGYCWLLPNSFSYISVRNLPELYLHCSIASDYGGGSGHIVYSLIVNWLTDMNKINNDDDVMSGRFSSDKIKCSSIYWMRVKTVKCQALKTALGVYRLDDQTTCGTVSYRSQLKRDV
jgi:hypothetical protein